jgi:hypothetical protein
MNQYRCDKVRTCGSCHHSVFEPEGMFCNHHEPYFKTRLDSWTREPPVWCPLPVHSDFQSERDKFLKRMLECISQYEMLPNGMDFVIEDLLAELRQAGEP